MNVNQTQMLDCLIASLEGPSEVATYQFLQARKPPASAARRKRRCATRSLVLHSDRNLTT